MNDLSAPESAPAATSVAAPPTARRGHWGVSALGLLASLGLALWCQHWLSSAQFSAGTAHPAQTNRYIQALLLMLPAISGVAFFGARLGGWRWLLWLALVLLSTECLLLAGTYVVLRELGSVTATLTGLLSLGLIASLGAGYYLLRERRRLRS